MSFRFIAFVINDLASRSFDIGVLVDRGVVFEERRHNVVDCFMIVFHQQLNCLHFYFYTELLEF